MQLKPKSSVKYSGSWYARAIVKRLNNTLINTLMITICFVVIAALPLAAQSNEFVDEFLAQEQVSYGNAAYLLLVGSGELAEDASPAEAHAAMEARPHALGRGEQEAITLGEYAHLTMEAFGISGGIMYTLVPSPRYAARELAFRDVIQGRTYPRMDVSGERALRIVGRVLDLNERGHLQ